MQSPFPASRDRIVQVSTNTLNWPLVCACCGEPAVADVATSQTLSTGEPIVRVVMQDWSAAPACTVCAHHIERAKKSDALRAAGDQSMAVAMGAGPVVYFAALLIFGLIFRSLQIGFWLAALAAGITVLVAYQQKREQVAKAEAILMDAIAAMRDYCVEVRPTVIYQGVSGTVHTFLFKNATYAELFIESNPDHIVV
jgi:hypothetical protein